MTIDEQIKRLRINAKDCRCTELDYYISLAEEYEQLADWLENYKILKEKCDRCETDQWEAIYQTENDSYNKGIDDFANKIVEINLLNCFQLYVKNKIDLEELMILASKEIAEKLKINKRSD